MENNYIICKRVTFYSPFDEDIFFDWIKRIPCIDKLEAAHDELYLDLVARELDYNDMKDLIALCHRYKIKMDQLAVFVNNNNKDAVEPWKKQIYKTIK